MASVKRLLRVKLVRFQSESYERRLPVQPDNGEQWRVVRQGERILM